MKQDEPKSGAAMLAWSIDCAVGAVAGQQGITEEQAAEVLERKAAKFRRQAAMQRAVRESRETNGRTTP